MENFEIKDDIVMISVNPKLYSLDVIYSAAYIFTENNYIILDGNLDEEIIVGIKPKEKNEDMKRLAMEFNNELINYGSHAVQSSRNSRLREMILYRVLQTTGAALNNPEKSELENSSKPWKENGKS